MKRSGLNGSERGTTIVELMLVMMILVVALSIFSGTVAATSRQRSINRENSIASEAAKQVFEDMRSIPLREIWTVYNPGAGHRFAVEGLEPVEDSPDGMIGEVFLPSLNAGTELAPVWQLREDVIMRNLGMPRDLNGDLVIDDQDHGEDYFRLPVEIQLEWRGEAGDRRLGMVSMLCEFEFGS